MIAAWTSGRVTTEPGSKSEQALNLLARWTATPDEETADSDHE